MLSIIGKLAAIYGERVRDAQVMAAVNDIETLTTGLGRKVWQKIMLLHDRDHTHPGPADIEGLHTQIR